MIVMEKNQTTQSTEKEYYVVDVMHILRTLWHRVWIIIIAGVLAAAAGFSYAAFLITPEYSSSVLLYVNNKSINVGSTTLDISTGDLSAAQSLVKTYTVILKNRTTLERVIERADVDYTYIELNGMIEAGQTQETEVMKVTVTGKDPYEAAKIANCIAEILPARITEIIQGATMEVVDSAIPMLQKVFPSITKYTAVAMLLGVFVSALVIAILAMLDDTIHDEDYVIQTYDYPILAKIPDLLGQSSRTYGYYYYRQKNSGANK